MNGEILPVAAGVLFSYAAIGSFFAGFRLLASRTFLPFHEQAAGLAWERIPDRVRLLILGLMRVAGLGAMMTGILCLLDCVPSYFEMTRGVAVIAGGAITLYWFGVFAVTLYVHKRTRANTPFKASLSVFAATAIGTVARAVA